MIDVMGRMLRKMLTGEAISEKVEFWMGRLGGQVAQWLHPPSGQIGSFAGDRTGAIPNYWHTSWHCPPPLSTEIAKRRNQTNQLNDWRRLPMNNGHVHGDRTLPSCHPAILLSCKWKLSFFVHFLSSSLWCNFAATTSLFFLRSPNKIFFALF